MFLSVLANVYCEILQSLCTDATRPLYGCYKTLVPLLQGPCTDSTKPLYTNMKKNNEKQENCRNRNSCAVARGTCGNLSPKGQASRGSKNDGDQCAGQKDT